MIIFLKNLMIVLKRVLALLLLMLVILQNEIVPQVQRDIEPVIFLRVLGIEPSMGINYLHSDYAIKKVGVEGALGLIYLFPIKSNFTSFGIKQESGYGRLTGRDLFRTPSSFRADYFTLKGGGVLNLSLSRTITLSLNALAGMIFFNPKQYNGELMPNNNNGLYAKSSFMISPGIDLKVWLSRSVSLDIKSSITMPFMDYLDDIAEFSWDSYSSLRVGVSFYSIRTLDEDNDGVVDDLDLGPGTPAKELTLVDIYGRSPSQRDTDKDGVSDKDDKCPSTPHDDRTLVDIFGCSPSERDTDNDGVNDKLDICPESPPSDFSYIDSLGCGPSQKDGDLDGVYDVSDLCPETPFWDRVYGVNRDGCGRSERDSDGDGIVDLFDNCNSEPEDYNFFNDGDGCPDKPDYDIVIKLNEVQQLFEENSSILLESGKNILRAHPLILLNTYQNTLWIIEIKSPSLHTEKAHSIITFMNSLTQNSGRISIKSSYSEVEVISIFLDKKNAKTLAIDNQKEMLIKKKEE